MSETANPFDNDRVKLDAQHIGMWVFLAGELLLFGVLFLSIFSARHAYPEGAREISRELDFVIGGANTAILLTSSFLVAWALEQRRQARFAATLFGGAALLGIVFLAIKIGLEYRADIAKGLFPDSDAFPVAMAGARLFFNLYLVATVAHAIHLSVGVMLLAGAAIALTKGALKPVENFATLRAIGLYWHFVDVVWIFLYPTLYLVK